MGAHIRLVSSEHEDRAGLDGEAIAVDEAPVGLPEETGADEGRPAESRRDEMLGEAAPPLVAEPEDRAGGPGGRERPKGAFARLIAFVGLRKAKAAAAIIEAGSAQAAPEERPNRSEGKPPKGALAQLPPARAGSESRCGDMKTKSPKPRRLWASGEMRTRGQTRLPSRPPGRPRPGTGRNSASGAWGRQGPAKPRRRLFARKGAIAVVVMRVAAAAIVVLNWPHGSPPQAVEPGLLADQPTKVLAPSAALATVPPREEPNVARERPQVRETRGDEVQEVLSFKDPKAPVSPPAGLFRGLSVASVPTPDPAAAAGPTLAVSAPAPSPAAAAPVATRNPRKSPRSRHPLRLPLLSVKSPLRLQQQLQEPGLGEVAKIESRLEELEAAIKEPSNATVTRADVDKAETQTSDQISRLAAVVTRLTGQVKDLEDQVRSESAGAQEKLTDLTRRGR